MLRAAPWMAALCLVAACVGPSTEPRVQVTAETFAGTWASITPTYEFIRLTVAAKSSEQGVLAGRLTFSGTYWDGQGGIDGDSLTMAMAWLGGAQRTATLVVRERGVDTLRLAMRSASANPLELTLVRER